MHNQKSQSQKSQKSHNKQKESVMKKTVLMAVLVTATLALTAGCSTKIEPYTPHLVVNAKLDTGVVLATGEANPSVTLSISITCLTPSAENPNPPETLTVAAGETGTVALCHGDGNVTTTATENWEGSCPSSVPIAERSDHTIDCVLKRKATASNNQAVLDAIAALQTALANCDTQSEEACKADVQAALDALTALGVKLDSLSADLKAQFLRQWYRGSMKLTVKDNAQTAITGAICTEVNVDWASLPAGENMPRTCTSNTSGDCEIKYLYVGSPLIFECVATSYATERIPFTLKSEKPDDSMEVRLQAVGNAGDLIWLVGIAMSESSSRSLVGSLLQVQADGTRKVVNVCTSGLVYTTVDGSSSVSFAPACDAGSPIEDLLSLVKGCAHLKASLGGKDVTMPVRVFDATGSPGTCTP